MVFTRRRSAFTLVEMLVVLGIIAGVAAMFIPIVLNMTDRDQVPKAASMVENALSIAKSRAVSEHRPCGIRLVIANSALRNLTTGQGFAWYDQIQYIEDQGDYNQHWVWGISTNGTSTVVSQPWFSRNPAITPPDITVPVPSDLPVGYDDVTVGAGPFTFTALVDTAGTVQTRTNIPRNRLLFGPICPLQPAANRWQGANAVASGIFYRAQRFEFSFVDNVNAAVTANVASLAARVQPGDKVEINGVGEIYTIVSVSAANAAGRVTSFNVNISGNANVIPVPVIELDRPLTRDVLPSVNGRANYRIIRQPRVIEAIPPVKFPQDVVIDLTNSRVPFFAAPPATSGGPLFGVRPNADIDSTGTISMSGVSAGINTTLITGINQTAVANRIAPQFVDILFSPTGEILPTNQDFGNQNAGGVFGQFNVGSSGLVALWLHSRGDPNLWAARQITAAQGNADNQAIVAINGRTGFIGSYPLSNNTADPLANARTGKGRISADTGQ
ncbi:MAG: type II secretion system protein [Gemmatales bacterium]